MIHRSFIVSIIAAVAVFCALFGYRFVTAPTETGYVNTGRLAVSTFGDAKKNYASEKYAAPAGQSIGNSQKFEKVATLTQKTSDYEADRSKINAAIEAHKGIVQYEQAEGLKGQRIANFAIGVPPDSFDTFVIALKAVGRNAVIEVVKNDKTNDYLQLRAKRTTLEKARTDLEALKDSGGSLDGRLNVLAKLTDIEQQIQELGVDLGDFDSQNELCTVKLTLQENVKGAGKTLRSRLADAFEWTIWRYMALGIGFFGLMVGGALLALLFRLAQQSIGAATRNQA